MTWAAKAAEGCTMDEASQSPTDPSPNGDTDEAPTDRELQTPPLALSTAELQNIREAFTGQDPESRRFSMWGLLGIVTAASLVLAVGSYLPKPVFAGGVGIATLLSMVALSAMKNPPAVLQVAWWVLLLIYVMAIGSAIWR
jgi:hypothetical protein